MHQQNFVAQAIPIQDIRPIDKAQNGIGVGNVGDPSYTLDKMDTQGVAVLATTYIVRRLMPIECERLQGFPDGWTDIRDNTPDSPRYKAIGNSMAVPCMKWIGNRIDKDSKRLVK
jgi:DNA (cytosine-5)-methyltransferase 1